MIHNLSLNITPIQNHSNHEATDSNKLNDGNVLTEEGVCVCG